MRRTNYKKTPGCLALLDCIPKGRAHGYVQRKTEWRVQQVFITEILIRYQMTRWPISQDWGGTRERTCSRTMTQGAEEPVSLPQPKQDGPGPGNQVMQYLTPCFITCCSKTTSVHSSPRLAVVDWGRALEIFAFGCLTQLESWLSRASLLHRDGYFRF